MKNYIYSFLSNRALSRFSILLIDYLIILFSCFAIYIVNYGFGFASQEDSIGAMTLSLILIFFNTVFFISFRTFSGVLRFSSFSDLIRIIYSLLFGYVLSYIAILVIKRFNDNLELNNLLFIAIFFLNMFLMVFSRILVKEIYEKITDGTVKPLNVFIYGTKQAGISVAKALKGNNEFNYRVRGFISDEQHMIGKQLIGVSIYPNDEILLRTLEAKDVRTIIVSHQKMEEIKNSDLLANFVDNNISLLTTVPVNEWNGKVIKKAQIKDVQIEDLLPRDPINVNMMQIADNLEGKRVMVTGAAGSIGSEIVRQVASFNPYSIILIDQAETPLHDMRLELQEKWRDLRTEIIVADISNAPRMEKVFNKTRPHYIFHAAAYKHVPMIEDNVSESVQTNILGAKIISDLAVKYKAQKFVMVSTDKAVNPSNVMGCSKRICEIYVQSLAKHLEKSGLHKTQFITTRFGNVLGSNGSVIPLFREQIRKGGPVTVTHPEIIRYFMTISEACQLVLEAGSMGENGEIYIFDMGKPVKILDLAKRMIRLSGNNNVKIEFTGLRHGEKLYEELLNMKEITKPTHHEKIMIANVREYEYSEVAQQIDNLIKVSYEFDEMSIVKMMKEIVPEFRSINSPFEELDN
jgi:FlaA1/EpsC-like NDP-sugar epimerase